MGSLHCCICKCNAVIVTAEGSVGDEWDKEISDYHTLS